MENNSRRKLCPCSHPGHAAGAPWQGSGVRTPCPGPRESASTLRLKWESVEVVPGNPDPTRICTSIVERSNLSLRMGCRRFTRLTKGFGRKWENQWAAVMLWYTYYNFCRILTGLLA